MIIKTDKNYYQPEDSQKETTHMRLKIGRKALKCKHICEICNFPTSVEHIITEFRKYNIQRIRNNFRKKLT